MNAEIKNYCIESQKSYELSLISQMDRNPKLFHAYIKHRKVSRPSIGPLQLPDDSLTDSLVAMAECFLQGFASVFCHFVPSNPAQNQFCFNNVDPLIISPDDVQQVLMALDPNSSMGDDGIHPRLLINLSSVLSVPLSVLFNNSLNSSILPGDWLESTVVPVYKKGPRYNPLNYRPISITSVVCKSLERLIVSHICEYLEINELISEHQYGFRSGYSTTEQLLLTYDYVGRHLDKK